jgi:hypothetical protein
MLHAVAWLRAPLWSVILSGTVIDLTLLIPISLADWRNAYIGVPAVSPRWSWSAAL